VAERIYISDADLQLASDLEVIRISRRIVADLNSSFPGKRKKMIQKLRAHANSNPFSTIPLLLRYIDHVDARVRDYANQLVEELTRTTTGEQALIESIFSSHHAVGDSAAAILEARNLEGVRYRELYVQGEKSFSDCKSMGIYTGDLRDMFLEAIRLYKEKLVEQAFENLILVNDLLRDRIDWNRNTKRYIQDVLRLTPQLSNSGVSMENIHESLKALNTAMKTRDYRETKDLIESKKLEATIGSQLVSVFSFMSRRLKGSKINPAKNVPPDQKWIFDSMKKVATEVKNYVKKGKKTEALEGIYSFVAQELAGKYVESTMSEIESGNQDAEIAAGQVMLGIAKMVNLALPNLADELFESYLKSRLGKANIEDVPWPSPLKDLGKR